MPSLRVVAWTSVWNYTGGLHRDGAGSRIHLTETAGLAGKTLCGRDFPSAKGYPSPTRRCSHCLRMARLRGILPDLGVTGMEWVGSSYD